MTQQWYQSPFRHDIGAGNSWSWIKDAKSLMLEKSMFWCVKCEFKSIIGWKS